MRVQRECAPEPTFGFLTVAQAALDHCTVEELRCILCPESQRSFRMVQRLLAATVAGEGPRKHVVTVDGGPIAVRRTRTNEGPRQTNGVIDIEERGFEIRPDTVRAKEALDRSDERVLPARGCLPAGHLKEIA
jgi:hypothetical protein